MGKVKINFLKLEDVSFDYIWKFIHMQLSLLPLLYFWTVVMMKMPALHQVLFIYITSLWPVGQVPIVSILQM